MSNSVKVVLGGIALMVTGGSAFLYSLGSGGGYGATLTFTLEPSFSWSDASCISWRNRTKRHNARWAARRYPDWGESQEARYSGRKSCCK